MTTMNEAMTMMFERSKDRMTLDELDRVAMLVDEAADEARRLSGLCEGLGCLVAFYDKGGRTGSFRDPDTLSGLLFALAHSFDTVAAMAEAGDRAKFEASQRRSAHQEARP